MKSIILLATLAFFVSRAVNNSSGEENTTHSANLAVCNSYSFAMGMIKKSVADSSFVERAIAANQQEIMMANMALERSNDAEIKRIAQLIINDHQQVLQQLQNVHMDSMQNNSQTDSVINGNTGTDTMNSNLASDTVVNNMSGGTGSPMTNYSNLSGNSFDRQWVSDMISGHIKALDEYRRELNNNESSEVKNIINSALPKIQSHLNQLQTLRNKMM